MENLEHQDHHDHHGHETEKYDPFKITLSILVVLLVVSNIFTVYYLFNKKDSGDNTNTNPIVNENTNDVPDDDLVDDDQEDDDTNDEVVVDLTEGEILVEWFPENEPVILEEFFGEDKIALQQQNYKYLELDTLSAEKKGKIIEGEYMGDLVYYVFIQEMGISQHTAIKHGDDVIVLNKGEYNICDNNRYEYLCIKNAGIKIKNLETPDSIDIPSSNLALVKYEYTTYKKFDNSTEDYKELFEYAPGKYIYEPSAAGSALYYFTEAEDHTIRDYRIELNFAGKEGDPAQYFGKNPHIFDITWSGNVQNEEAFLQQHVGSIFRGAAHARANYIDGIDDLKITGYTNTNDPIYELKDTDVKERDNDTKNIFEKMYDGIYSPKDDKISYEDFLTKHPIIFWEDPFGNILEFRNAAYMPAAEMAKPVIYLYPEKTTNIAVKVSPNKGLTITEPAYKDGWFVKADPDGTLYNYDDKQTYPYLFWEGLGIDYTMPKQGFVVAKEDVKTFLVDSLAKQGLVPAEYNEFIEFWAPKMQEKPYYFITFVPQPEFDRLAPLEVSPQPDTIIRVFMDYKGLNKKINVQPQILQAPARKGFVLIEWGGALR